MKEKRLGYTSLSDNLKKTAYILEKRKYMSEEKILYVMNFVIRFFIFFILYKLYNKLSM